MKTGTKILILLLGSMAGGGLCYCFHVWFLFHLFLAVAIHIVLMCFTAAMVSLMFKERFTGKEWWFTPKSWEKSLYRFLRIKKWKAKLPVYDAKIFDLTNSNEQQLIGRLCHGEVVHEAVAFVGFLPAAVGAFFPSRWIYLVTSAVFALIHIAFALVQRYNRPRFQKYYQYIKRISK